MIWLILFMSLAIHEGVHLWQCYDDPNAHFKGFYLTWDYTYVIIQYTGIPKYSITVAETQAYCVQIFFLVFVLSIYVLKKETDKQIAKEILNRLETKYFQEVRG
jgi:hypothetical protein